MRGEIVSSPWLYAAREARALLADADVLILDSETTGLDSHDQIIALAILHPSGRVLFETLVRPTVECCEAARAVHGITDAELAMAPDYPGLHALIASLIAGKHLVIFNAAFDVRLLQQTAAAHGLAAPAARAYTCAMDLWMRFNNEDRWRTLPGGDHTAAGDARAVLHLLRRMAAAAERAERAERDQAPTSSRPVRIYNERTDRDIPADAVYVGRPSVWGNPFAIGEAHPDNLDRPMTRDDVCDLFEGWATARSSLEPEWLAPLRGKDLVCWCAPLRCHAETLARLANREVGDGRA